MSDKDRIDDFASLFLPDLLHASDSMAEGPRIKLEDDLSAFARGQQSAVSSPSSIGMGVFRFLNSDQALDSHVPLTPEVSGQLSSSYPMYMQSQPFGLQPSQPRGNYNFGQQASHLPLGRLDFGHTLHYSDFIPAEAGLQQQQMILRQHLLGPIQQGFGQGFGQLDGSPWLMPQEPFADMRNNMYSNQASVDRIQGSDRARTPGDPGKVAPKKAAPKKSGDKTSKVTKPVGSLILDIKINYSEDALLQLLDLKETRPPTAGSLNFEAQFRGFMCGKLLTNDYDNANYYTICDGSVDKAFAYSPKVVTSYRRNFTNIFLNLEIDHAPSVDGQPVQSFRIDLTAVTDREESKAVALSTNEDERDNKENTKTGDNLPIEVIAPGHRVSVADISGEMYFMFRKVQFKTATANSTNLSFQTYNRIKVRLVACFAGGEKIVKELESNPIIVRGRNPSFYKSRNDVLLKSRSPIYAKSYQVAAMDSVSPLSKPEPITSEPVESHAEAPSAESSELTESREVLCDSEKINATTEAKIAQEDDLAHESDNDSADDSDSETREKNAGLVQNSGGSDLKAFLKAMTEKKDSTYHYFPMLKVYYLPPINVVYFPHGAHHADSIVEEPDSNSAANVSASTPSSQTTTKKNPTSKVYFR